MRLRLLLPLGLFVSGTAVGCSLLFDAGNLPVSTGELDAAPDVASLVDPCVHATPPARPPTSANAGDGGLVVALDHFAMVVGGGDHLGYDLDGLCTCDGRPGAPSGGSCAPVNANATMCDQPGGRDNAAATMISRLFPGSLDGGLDVAYDRQVAAGAGATLIAVAEYNGTAEDDALFVALFDSPGLEAPSACAQGASADSGSLDGGTIGPDWSGCDRWMRSTESVFAGQPRVFTREAWVTHGTLVARFAVLPVLVDNTPLVLSDVIVTGTLGVDPPSITGGLLAGRATAANVLRVFGERQTVHDGPGLCAVTAAFALVRAAVCDSRDLAPAVPGDGGLPTCDSLSMTLELSARAALLGVESPPLAKELRCVDAGDFARCE
jgi:hypothetical protein